MDRWVFEGVEYATRGEMCAARRRRYVEHLEAGMNFTQAARAVGVSKRTGKVWRCTSFSYVLLRLSSSCSVKRSAPMFL